VPITYEEMMNVQNWDSSKFIFKKEKEGFADDMGGGFQMVAPVTARKADDKHVSECAICYSSGTLICCDDCPTAFHAECLGYLQHLPRGKWKCYYCKVIRHGIPNKVQRLAPNIKAVCDVLAEPKNWEVKAN
jgi:hypothetical protein